MKIVREHLNETFSEYGDPIKDMGIGVTTKNVLDAIIKEDRKHDIMKSNKYILGNGSISRFVITGAVGRGQQHKVGTYFKIEFPTWQIDFYSPPINGKRKRMTFRDKANYYNQIIIDAGFNYLFSDFNFNPKDKGVVNFRIKPEYKNIFRPGTYEVK